MTRLVRIAVEAMEAARVYSPDDIHDQYALRVSIAEYGLEELRERYNEHNVPGPRGVLRMPTLVYRGLWVYSRCSHRTG